METAQLVARTLCYIWYPTKTESVFRMHSLVFRIFVPQAKTGPAMAGVGATALYRTHLH